jgi:hypothetical protein
VRDNFAPVGLLLAFADGGEKLYLLADILQLCVFRKPVQQFNDELFVAHGLTIPNRANASSAGLQLQILIRHRALAGAGDVGGEFGQVAAHSKNEPNTDGISLTTARRLELR